MGPGKRGSSSRALERISKDKEKFRELDRRLPNGDDAHEGFTFDPEEVFSVERVVGESLGL